MQPTADPAEMTGKRIGSYYGKEHSAAVLPGQHRSNINLLKTNT
jgi:hypothetical protein